MRDSSACVAGMWRGLISWGRGIPRWLEVLPPLRVRARVHGDRVDCAACGFFAYGNSIPGTEAVIVDGEGRVLLGRRAFEPHVGRWDLPGGFLHEGEDPLAALQREVHEETGLDDRARRLARGVERPYGGEDGRHGPSA